MLLVACGKPSSPGPHRVSYAVAWSDDGATWNADRTAFEVTNDLGYRVRVTRGYLTTYSMELVECPKDARSAAADVAKRLWATLEAPAWAGHASGTPNPAAIRPMQIESLLAPVARELAGVTLAPQAYCQLHYLIARAAKEAVGLPADLDMVDTSLHVDGTYRAPVSEAEVPFGVHTAVANGGLLDRSGAPPAPIHVDTGRESAHVTVRRQLAALFDGVDFAKMKGDVIAGQMLQSFVDHLEVDIETGT
jgi:hypothetical protein